MFKNSSIIELTPPTLKQLPKGAFLTAGNGEKNNTMTIGWGVIGEIWGRPMFNVLVRYSRYTYDLMEETPEFTVSVPVTADLSKELAFCGSKSGRDVDKFAALGLTVLPAQKVKPPVIEKCDIFYECRTIYKQAMEPGLLDPSLKSKFYSGAAKGNFHVVYYGEILASYCR